MNALRILAIFGAYLEDAKAGAEVLRRGADKLCRTRRTTRLTELGERWEAMRKRHKWSGGERRGGGGLFLCVYFGA